jgi:hypothetical protein
MKSDAVRTRRDAHQPTSSIATRYTAKVTCIGRFVDISASSPWYDREPRAYEHAQRNRLARADRFATRHEGLMRTRPSDQSTRKTRMARDRALARRA